MTTKEKYSYEVRKQIKNGVDFSKNVFETPISLRIELAEIARKYHYKKSNLNHSLGVCFYLLLQRVYNQLRNEGAI